MAQALRSQSRESSAAAQRQPTRPAPLILPHHFRRRHHAAAILVVVVLAVVTFQVFPGKDVTVINDGKTVRVSTTFDTGSDAIDAASLSIEPGDRLLEGYGGKHASVAVQRARPVLIETDGRLVEMRTHSATIAGALAEAGIDLGPSDEVLLDDHRATVRTSLASSAYVARQVTHEVAVLSPQAVKLTVLRARPISVFVDTLRVDLSSAAGTVEEVLGELGMTIREEDLVKPALDAPVTAGMSIRLAKARSVNLRLDGKDQVLYTQAQTVADVLAILGVDPGTDEILVPSRETPVTSGMSIVIGLHRIVDERVQEIIPAPTVYENDPSLASGQVRVVPGTPGLRETTYRINYENGVETSRLAVTSKVLQQPVPTRQVTGSKVSAVTKPTLDVPGYSGPYTARLTVRATWYNASHGAWARDDPNYGRTATGVMVGYGICAVDPSVIPLGTRFYVPGYGTCLAADTGGLVKGNTVDLGFPEEAGSSPWATQTLDIYILG